MKQFLIATCLLLVVAWADSKSAKIAKSALLVRPPAKNCTLPGIFCEDCSSRVMCLQVGGDGGFQKIPLETCKSPAKCVSGRCSTDVDPVCDNMVDVPFVCGAPGLFPHPFHCNSYVFCVPAAKGALTSVVAQCEPGFSYNPLTTECDRLLKGDVCPATGLPLPLCKGLGDAGALPSNPSIYYVCKPYSDKVAGLYPFQYVCPAGKKFANFKCA